MWQSCSATPDASLQSLLVSVCSCCLVISVRAGGAEVLSQVKQSISECFPCKGWLDKPGVFSWKRAG